MTLPKLCLIFVSALFAVDIFISLEPFLGRLEGGGHLISRRTLWYLLYMWCACTYACVCVCKEPADSGHFADP